MASKKKTNGTKRKARAAADASENKVVEVRMMPATTLKRELNAILAIREENASRAGTIGEITKRCAEAGMDTQGIGILARLLRKGKTNPHTLGSILRTLDYGREVLDLDGMVPADLFEEPVEGKKTHRKKKAAAEEPVVDPKQIDIETSIEHSDDTNVENFDEYRTSAA